MNVFRQFGSNRNEFKATDDLRGMHRFTRRIVGWGILEDQASILVANPVNAVS